MASEHAVDGLAAAGHGPVVGDDPVGVPHVRPPRRGRRGGASLMASCSTHHVLEQLGRSRPDEVYQLVVRGVAERLVVQALPPVAGRRVGRGDGRRRRCPRVEPQRRSARRLPASRRKRRCTPCGGLARGELDRGVPRALAPTPSRRDLGRRRPRTAARCRCSPGGGGSARGARAPVPPGVRATQSPSTGRPSLCSWSHFIVVGPLRRGEGDPVGLVGGVDDRGDPVSGVEVEVEGVDAFDVHAPIQHGQPSRFSGTGGVLTGGPAMLGRIMTRQLLLLGCRSEVR